MKHYELVLMITPNQSDQVSMMLERYQQTITESGGKVHRAEDWGRHQLTYLINGVHKAHYIMLNIEIDQDTLDKLVNSFKFNDAILRNLIISKKSGESETSAMKLALDAENSKSDSRSDKTDSRDNRKTNVKTNEKTDTKTTDKEGEK